MNTGLISKLISWGNQPLLSEGTWELWGAALVLLLILAFLWSTVIREITEG